MVDVTEARTISRPIEQVWELIGAFDTIHVWHPAIAASETYHRDGVTFRRLTLTSGDTIEESMDSHCDEAMSYSYTMTDFGPLPLAEYHATLSVAASGPDESVVTFVGTFEPKGVPKFVVSSAVSRIFKAGLDGITQHLGALA